MTSDPLAGVEFGNATIDGQCLADTPIAGSAVEATFVEDDGTLAEMPVATAVTDADGRFHLETGVEYGPLLITCTGGTTHDFATGDEVVLAPDARLALVLYDFDFDVELTVAVTPLSTMAEALGNARLARGDKETTYPEAHARADALLGDHIGGVDVHANVPDDPRQAGGGTLTEAARYGLAMAALGELAHAIAEESQVSANVVNTMTLTHALADDLGSSEALFDSMGPDGAVVVGSCPVPDTCADSACSTICDIGPRTVRGDLANQLEAFVTSTANATGLGTTDIREMKAHIAKDAEPELFGDAPVPGDGPLLTLSDSDFYVDPDTGIWWSPSAGPSLGGTVESADATIASVTVTVGSTTVTANLFGGDKWAIGLGANALARPPATNMVSVVATDAIGNVATLEKEMRVNDSAATVAYLDTTVIDERDDTVNFGSVPPTEAHPGSSVTLSGSGCPSVYKHIQLMGTTDNPIHYRFRVTDAGVGIDPASVVYRVRKQGASTWLLDATTPDQTRAITGGVEADVYLTRATLPELATYEGQLEVVASGTDLTGSGADVTACFDNHPLGPPLKASNPRPGMSADVGDGPIQDAKLVKLGLNNNNLAPLIDGVPASAGAGVMLFDVQNPWPEPVYFEVGPKAQPSTSASKTWRRTAVIISVTNVSLDCRTTPTYCNKSWPYSDETKSASNLTVSTLIRGSRVWDMSGAAPQPLAHCAGCNANRYLIPAASGGTPHMVRVMLVATDLSPLYPGDSDTGDFVEYHLDNLEPQVNVGLVAHHYDFTGKLLQTFTRCTKEKVVNNSSGQITSISAPSAPPIGGSWHSARRR